MNEDRTDSPDDETFVNRLAALDEALAVGGVPSEVAPPAGRSPKWEEAAALVARLHRLKPKVSSGRFAPVPANEGGPDGIHDATPLTAGRYTIGRLLGQGGYGSVYLGYDPDLERPVAIKVLNTRTAPKDLDRIRAEGAFLGRLRHPNIVAVYDAGRTDAGRPYLVMEYAPGGSVHDLIRRAYLAGRPDPVTPADAARLVAAVADATAVAHANRVVHRDIKPENILLAADGTPKLTDFGLAKGLGSKGASTRTGAVVGTAAYMAPEQAAGRRHEVGPPSDVYGLGAVLYELLTGRPPFQGAFVAVILQQVCNLVPPAPREMNPAVPTDLNTICMKCLEKDPARRYPTARELADDLRQFLAGRPTTARPAGPVERLCRLARRHPVLAFLFIGMTVKAVIAIAALVVVVSSAERDRERVADSIAELTAERDAAARGRAETETAARAIEGAAAERDARAAAVVRFLATEVLAASRPESAGGLGGEVTVRQALDRAAARVDPLLAGDPAVAAAVDLALAAAFTAQGDQDRAAELTGRAATRGGSPNPPRPPQ